MDAHLVHRIEQLLNYPADLSSHDLNHRLQELEHCFQQLYPMLPKFTTTEKALFLKLLSQCNDLVRMGMEQQMKALNLTPEKLKMIFEHAQKSSSPEAKGLIHTLEHMRQQAEDLKRSLSKANVKLSSDIAHHGTFASPEQQRLKRSKWQKP